MTRQLWLISPSCCAYRKRKIVYIFRWQSRSWAWAGQRWCRILCTGQRLPSWMLVNPSKFEASNPDVKTSCSGSRALSNTWFGCPLCWISCLQSIPSDAQYSLKWTVLLSARAVALHLVAFLVSGPSHALPVSCASPQPSPPARASPWKCYSLIQVCLADLVALGGWGVAAKVCLRCY